MYIPCHVKVKITSWLIQAVPGMCFKYSSKQSDLKRQVQAQTSNEPRHEKTCFCIWENKGTDQLHGNRPADLCLFIAT